MIGVLVTCVAGPASAGRVVRNDPLRLRSFELPRGWVPSTQNGYPKILALASGPDDARLLVGGQHVTPGTTALTLAADARAVLLKQGFTDVRVAPEPELPGGAERVRLDAGYQGGKRTLRQYYVVDVDVALVFTVTMDAARARGLRDVELAVGALQLSPLDMPVVPQPPPGDVAPADGGAR